MTVHFIGAGPGAADLITVRGRDLIARCPVCLYAGSLVPQGLLAHCPPGARIIDTAPLSLDQIEREFIAAHEAGQDVARLHSGDLSIYSALGLIATAQAKADEVGIVDAAAALGARLVLVSQTALVEAGERVITKSERVQELIGIPSLAEAAALAAGGTNARLLAPRIVVGPVTCALGETP